MSAATIYWPERILHRLITSFLEKSPVISAVLTAVFMVAVLVLILVIVEVLLVINACETDAALIDYCKVSITC